MSASATTVIVGMNNEILPQAETIDTNRVVEIRRARELLIWWLALCFHLFVIVQTYCEPIQKMCGSGVWRVLVGRMTCVWFDWTLRMVNFVCCFTEQGMLWHMAQMVYTFAFVVALASVMPVDGVARVSAPTHDCSRALDEFKFSGYALATIAWLCFFVDVLSVVGGCCFVVRVYNQD